MDTISIEMMSGLDFDKKHYKHMVEPNYIYNAVSKSSISNNVLQRFNVVARFWSQLKCFTKMENNYKLYSLYPLNEAFRRDYRATASLK